MKLVDVLRDKIEKAEEDVRSIDDRIGKALGFMVELEDNVVQKQTELDRVENLIGQLSRQNAQLDERMQRLRMTMEAKGAERLVKSAGLRLESLPTPSGGQRTAVLSISVVKIANVRFLNRLSTRLVFP